MKAYYRSGDQHSVRLRDRRLRVGELEFIELDDSDLAGLDQPAIGFIHRDLKPANVAVGRINTPDYRFLHILDFGLAREFVVRGDDQKLQMRRPRPRALF
ncbi:hypothetical protein OSTOST_18931, partial [Ostertagia ostertagi]